MAETTLSGLPHPILANDHASAWMGIEVLAVGVGRPLPGQRQRPRRGISPRSGLGAQ